LLVHPERNGNCKIADATSLSMEAGSTAVVNVPGKYEVGNNVRNASGRFHEPSASHAALWKQSQHNLNTGQFEQLSHAVQEAQQLQLQSGTLSADQMLAAAREARAAHQQAIDEVEFLRKAHQKAVEREQKLEQELQVLLGNAFAILATQSENQIAQSSTRADSPQPPAAALRSDSDLKEARSLVVHCLGPFRVFHSGQLITDWNGQKGLAVLKYLIAQRGKPVSKEILMEAIWSESDPEAARRNLHQAIYSLRQTLRSNKPDFRQIEFYNDRYQINPKSHLWIDFVAFEKLAQEGKQLVIAGRTEEALQTYTVAEALYQGDFLEGELYEEWAVAQREQLRLLYLEVASWLSEQFLKQGQFTDAIALAQKILAQDACHEHAHRCLMVAYAAQGQRHLAARQYLACVQVLRTELDLTPSAETTALYRQIASVN
jgi:DNA-binding SARP family transcriptional activator